MAAKLVLAIGGNLRFSPCGYLCHMWQPASSPRMRHVRHQRGSCRAFHGSLWRQGLSLPPHSLSRTEPALIQSGRGPHEGVSSRRCGSLGAILEAGCHINKEGGPRPTSSLQILPSRPLCLIRGKYWPPPWFPWSLDQGELRPSGCTQDEN